MTLLEADHGNGEVQRPRTSQWGTERGLCYEGEVQVVIGSPLLADLAGSLQPEVVGAAGAISPSYR